jgi:hypothetical protein
LSICSQPWATHHRYPNLLQISPLLGFGAPFTDSKLSRKFHSDNDDWASDTLSPHAFAHFFYMFATFEIVLQTSRYYIERGQLQESGILSTVGQLLPEPYAGYFRIIGWNSVIYSTVVSDAMVVVFVLGAMSWWRGGAAA